MRDAVSDNRAVRADGGRARGRMSALARHIFRQAFLAYAIATPALAGPTLHWGDRNRPLDPLFNLPYDPGQVHFDTVPLSEVAACAPLLEGMGRGSGRAKLFGNLATARAHVMVLGDENPRASRGLSGTVVVLTPGGCRTSGPLAALRRVSVGDPDLDPGLTPDDVSLLMRDILARYARAFGGRETFLQWTDRLTEEAAAAQQRAPDMPCPLLYTHMFDAPMLKAFAAFRGS